jgi:FAD/FMN-containing dehydrogenase
MLLIDELAGIVGADNVSASVEELNQYASDESSVPRVMPSCVVRPKSDDEVKKIIEWANATRTPLVPVSSGGPHFRGDTVPSVDGAVIVDMSGMDNIVRIDPEHRIAMVQPGVTYAQLIPALREAGLRLNPPLLPRATKSVMGSMLEREPVIMPKYHWDISDPMACMEVVYGSGDVFRTGSAAGPGTLEEQWAIGAAQNEAAGPIQADFLRLIQGGQGSMGLVTWATLRCEHLPTVEEGYLVGSNDLEPLLQFVHWLIRNRWADDCLVLNNSNLARMMTQDQSGRDRMRSSLPTWVLFYSISGTKYFPEDKVGYLKSDIADLAESVGVQPVGELGEVKASDLMELLHGVPAEDHWKSRGGESCSDVFFVSVYEDLERLVAAMEDKASESGQDMANVGIYLQPIVQGVNYHLEFNLFCDGNSAEQKARVEKLADAAVECLSAQGAFISRPYGSWVDIAYDKDQATVTALRKVKQIFDPNNIMNPGKLCFK